MTTRTAGADHPCDWALKTPLLRTRRRAALRQWLVATTIVALAAYAAADAVNAYAVVQGHLKCLPGLFHLV